MSDVSIQHHPGDRQRATEVMTGLGEWGLEARLSPGGRAILLLWTPEACNDAAFVAMAAEVPQAARVSARFAPCRLPKPFADEGPINVLGWSGDDHAGWTEMVERLAARAFARPEVAPEIAVAAETPHVPTVEVERAPVPEPLAVAIYPVPEPEAPAAPRAMASEQARSIFAALPLGLIGLVWVLFAFFLIRALWWTA